MKTIKFLSIISIISFLSFEALAQTPAGINYQAAARDGNGDVMSNKSISVKAVIATGSSGSNVEYTETHSVTTNDYGLFNIIIGQGSTSDNFGALSWGSKKHHLKIEIDAGNGFVSMGTVAFEAVPYALSARNVENIPTINLNDLGDVSSSSATNGQYLQWNGTSWVPANASSGNSITAGSGLTLTGTVMSANSNNAIWNANKLQGNNVSNTSPSNGEVLKWNGSMWAPAVDNNSSYSAGSGIGISSGVISASSSSAIWNANQLQGRALSTGAPGNGEVLKWNGSNWAPASDVGATYSAGTGLSLSGTTFSAANTTALWNANQWQGRNISNATPSSGQVMKWNGSMWAPAADNGASYSAGTGISISSNTINASNTSALWNASQIQGRNVSSSAPSSGQVLKWNGSTWAPAADNGGSSSGPWNSIGNTYAYTYRRVGVGVDSATTRFDIVDTIVGTGNGQFASSQFIIQGSTSNLSTANGHWINVNGRGGYTNVGIRSRVAGTSTATYNGSGAVGGLFIADGTTGQNDFGIQALSAPNNSATARNYGVYSHSRGDGTFNMGIFALANKSHNSSTKTNYGIYAWADSANTNYAGYFAGNVSYTGTLASASDQRLKTNIQPLSGALAKVLNVKVATYDYRTDGMAKHMVLPEGKQIGFIAQDLEKSFPELVETQIQAVGADSPEGMNQEQEVNSLEYKGVNYIGMVPVLTKAIQEQQEYIKLLEQRIADLESKLK